MDRLTKSERETFLLGKEIANMGKTFLIYGDLGSGKTALIKGICSGLGVSANEVHSPSFTIVNEYDSKTSTIYHIDAYRLSPNEWINCGFDEYINSGICLIEWADNTTETEGVKIKIEGSGNEQRCITISE